MASRFVVLLRAVNVGGRSLSMERWRAALLRSGLRPTTVGAAGSAVVEPASGLSAEALERAVEQALARTEDLVTDAFARDPAAWSRLVGANPFGRQAADDPAHLVVTVLKGDPRPSSWDDLRGAIVGRERVAPGERCAYLVYPDGIGRSKLTPALVERKLGVRGTGRNWSTVLRLQELVERAGRTDSRRGAAAVP